MTRKAVVIGAGHNGLVAACYLAKGGFEVEVLERRPMVGGMCVTEELFPGCNVSSLACRHGMLRKRIINDLNLEAHGLRGYRSDFSSRILGDGGCLNMDHATREGRISHNIADLTEEHLAEWDMFWDEIGRASRILADWQEDGTLTRDIYTGLLKEAGLIELAESVFRDTLLDYAERRLSHPALAVTAAAENFGHPCQQGSLFELIWLDTAESFEGFGQWGYALGGMGAVTQALLREAERLGVKVRCNAEVSTMEEAGMQWQIETAAGEVVVADVVLAATDPVTLYRKILDGQELPAELLEKVDEAVDEVSKAVIHLRLKDLPQVPMLETVGRGGERRFSGQLDFTVTLDALRAGWRDFEAEGKPFGLHINMATNMLSAMDDSVCAEGHVWTIVHFFCPSRYKGGDWTQEGRDALLATTLDILRPHVPDLDTLITDTHVITPTDLRDTYGVRTFTPVHLSFKNEQVLENRPFVGYGGYRTPLEQVYMCASGTNPGAMVTGMPGYLCAQQVLRDMA